MLLLFVFFFKLKIIQEITFVPFTHVFLLWVFYLICFTIFFFYTLSHVCTVIFSEPFESTLYASWPFIPKHFSVYFLRIEMLLHSTVVSFIKLLWYNTFIYSNIQILIFFSWSNTITKCFIRFLPPHPHPIVTGSSL